MEEDGWCAAWCPRKISPKIVRGLGLAFRRKLKIQRVEGNFRGRGGVRARNKEESEKGGGGGGDGRRNDEGADG